MFRVRNFFVLASLLLTALLIAPAAFAQETTASPQAPAAMTVEITPAMTDAEVGQKVKFTAVVKDASGKVVNQKLQWYALPFDSATADEDGTVSLFAPGEIRVLALLNGKPYFAKINARPAAVARIDVDAMSEPLAVGGTAKLGATAHTADGRPRSDAAINWTSDNPSVAIVDAAGVVTGIAPGKATVHATAGSANTPVAISVIQSNISGLSVEPRSATARTGDVIRFKASAQGAGNQKFAVRWSLTGDGATVDPDGGFVAERPGTYIVTASSGDHTASSSVVVSPRNIERQIQVVGRMPIKDFQSAEQWIIGNYAYMATISDKVVVYDISDPAHPKETDTIKVDARTINDVSTTPDGKIMVITREGASNRKNGIVFLDSSDPAHPKVISEYTETVTGGVHSAFIDSHYVYLTDDSTGSLRVIDFKDVKAPKEVARWQVSNPLVTNTNITEGLLQGRYLHDVQVKDGLAYLAYWRDGLVILDVGSGIKGGSPEKPQLVSQFHFNHAELYGDDWLAGSHAVFRYKNYVFVGDEVFPPIFSLESKERIPVRGIAHVIDVSDIEHPRKVAEYAVPEAGSHNIWVDNDVMYMGYYSGGARVVDVSGELRGDLYRQGREIGRLWTGDPNGYRSNLPFCWGAQPHNGLVYFNDINSGIWVTKLGPPKAKGSTTAPPMVSMQRQ
ncbi:MAG: Ig-like domain-containing protein [Pyrinomonadaceae bacterium]